jgi:hypothetical protein
MSVDAVTATLPAAGASVEPFPVGSRIIHIGPPKTGTSALQDACHAASASMLEQGVRYAGIQLRPAMPARAVTGLPTIAGRPQVPSIRWWTQLLEEMQEAREPRVLYSSEVFAEASEASIRRIAEDVGPEIQVLVTLRPLDGILASQWQQTVQHGADLSLDDYLRRVLGDGSEPPADPNPLRVFRHGALVERWAAVVGRDRVTVLILDRRDPAFLLRTAESLLALREGTLRATDVPANRSLTLPEVEVIRQLNRQAGAAQLQPATRARLVKSGAAAYVKRLPAAKDAAAIRLPAWAFERARELGTEACETLGASSVRVIGNTRLLALREPGPEPAPQDPRDSWVDPETAATMAMGMAWATGLELGRTAPMTPDHWVLRLVPGRVLAREIEHRLRRQLERIPGLGRRDTL